MKKKISYVLWVMDELFKDYPLTELNYKTPFQLLIAVILSAQTTDKQVNKVTSSFFDVVETPQDIIPLWELGVKDYIKTVWLHRSKTKNIVKTATILSDATEEKRKEWWKFSWKASSSIRANQFQYDNAEQLFNDRWYYVPDTIEWMQELAWVWIKTAKVVLYILYGQRRVAVDTHVHRVMNRLWIVKTKTPEQSSKLLEKIIPDDLKDVAHRVIIYFGRYLCLARNPQCERCPLTDICLEYRKINRWLPSSNK